MHSAHSVAHKGTYVLEIRKNSSWWYGIFVVNGKKTVVNLGVPITGKRPRKRTMIGDDEFERSRGRAMEAHDKQLRKLRRTGPARRPSPSWRS